MQIVELAPAKINLYLRIKGKRADGFHELETVMQTLDLADRLVLTWRPAGIELDCDDSRLSCGPDNLAYRAAALLAAEYPGQGVGISLCKRIPWQAGLGGGSSDAAAVLRGLNMLWRLQLPQAKLLELAARLGSDVPFFLTGGLAIATGRGEQITPLGIRLSGEVALVIPPFGLSTAAVYQAWTPKTQQPSTWRELCQALAIGDQAAAAERLHNDLERPAFALRPELADAKDKLARAGLPVLLSGSGSSLFVLLSAGYPIEHLGQLLPAAYQVILTKFS